MDEEQKLVQEQEQPTEAPSTAPPLTDQQKRQIETERQRADAVAGTDRQIKTIQDWMDMEGNRPESDEERKKRERREKSKKIIAAVSDGIGALSNLFFTSQYAPNMYNHDKGSQMSATNARIEQLKADREKNADRYMNFSLKLGDLENQKARTLRELEAHQEALKLAREKAEREAEAHGWQAVMQDDMRREQKGKADRAEQQAIAAQAEAEIAPEMQRAKLATENARTKAQNASATNSYASAAAHGRSNVGEFIAYDEKGNPHPFKTAKAAEYFARRHGTWQETDESETTTKVNVDDDGKEIVDNKQTKTKKGGYPAKPKKQSPTGGTGGNGKKSPTS